MPMAFVAMLALSACTRPAPPTWQLGETADPIDISSWNTDVRPDGTGLPDGHGDVAAGREVYANRCLTCHGENGRDGWADPLAGRIADDAFPFANDPSARRTIGSYWPYATTLFDYVNRAMPYDAPGTLSSDDVYAVTAYLLHLNELVDEHAVLDRTSLPAVRMPARDRFVPDNRRGGREVR